MSTIESNITIDVPDGIDPNDLISLLQHMVTGINGKNTYINVIEVDNPMSLSPLTMKKIEE